MDRIDYKDIADKYTFEEHAQRADRYFATIGMDSVVARKPFASAGEAVELCSGVSALLANLNLFPGARVLDFGSGACWLSRIFAMLGCEVTATDVSANALALGAQLLEADPLAKHLQVDFAVSREPRLPFADGTFDRVVVFDAFHHCQDQLAMIGEFHRVLKADGMVAFHEPGPEHSSLAQSQYEMRAFDVIEGDIVIEDLFAEARRVGFDKMALALYLARPHVVDPVGFDQFLAAPDTLGATLAGLVKQESFNRRVFFLHKGNPLALDSRSAAGLKAELTLSAAREGDGIAISGQVRNTGVATWLPSGGSLGSVNVGVHLVDADGRMLNNDYARLSVSETPVAPDGTCMIVGRIPAPDQPGFSLVFDLVAEGVAWFEIAGSEPVRVAF